MPTEFAIKLGELTFDTAIIGGLIIAPGQAAWVDAQVIDCTFPNLGNMKEADVC